MVRSLGSPLVVLMVVWGLAGCRDSRAGSFFDREVQRVQSLAMLAGAQSMARRGFEEKPSMLRQEWRGSTGMSWTSFISRTARLLEPSYQCQQGTMMIATCSRHLPGDLLLLKMVAEPAPAGLGVRMFLEMHPD